MISDIVYNIGLPVIMTMQVASTPLFGRHTAWEIWPRHCWTATIEAKLSNTPDKYKYTGQIQAHQTNTNTQDKYKYTGQIHAHRTNTNTLNTAG